MYILKICFESRQWKYVNIRVKGGGFTLKIFENIIWPVEDLKVPTSGLNFRPGLETPDN